MSAEDVPAATERATSGSLPFDSMGGTFALDGSGCPVDKIARLPQRIPNVAGKWLVACCYPCRRWPEGPPSTHARELSRRFPVDAERYDPQQVEPKWVAAWEELGLYRADEGDNGRALCY